MIDVIYRVYGCEGQCLEIGPDNDDLGTIEIRTIDNKSEEYYGGKISLMLTKEEAKELGQALSMITQS